MDKLNELFDLQSELNKRIGVDTDNMNDENKVKWVLNYTRAMQQRKHLRGIFLILPCPSIRDDTRGRTRSLHQEESSEPRPTGKWLLR